MIPVHVLIPLGGRMRCAATMSDRRTFFFFFSYVRLETRIREDHPLRAIRELVDAALLKLSPTFDRLYAREGRPSIPPGSCCEHCCCRRSIRCDQSGN